MQHPPTSGSPPSNAFFPAPLPHHALPTQIMLGVPGGFGAAVVSQPPPTPTPPFVRIHSIGGGGGGGGGATPSMMPMMMPPAPPPRPPMTADELSAACEHAVGWIVREGGFASYHAVVTRVCEAHGAACMAQLGATDPLTQAPVLGKIWRMQQLVEAHVAAFVGMRGVACLRDLEAELVAMLRSFGFGPARGERASDRRGAEASVNPEEIPLDDEVEEEEEEGEADEEKEGTAAALSFASFGLGPLTAVPIVQLHFRPPLGVQRSTSTGLSSADVAKHLADFLEEEERRVRGRYRRGVPVLGVDFARYLCDARGASDAAALGVRVDPGPLGTEVQVARHVAAAANREVERAAAAADAADREAERARAAAAMARRPPPPPRLKPPLHAAARGFLERCQVALASPWSPSRAKLGAAVDATWPGLPADVAAAATEYGMLHLGGGKYRARVMQLVQPDDKASEDDEQDEDDNKQDEEEMRMEDNNSRATTARGEPGDHAGANDGEDGGRTDDEDDRRERGEDDVTTGGAAKETNRAAKRARTAPGPPSAEAPREATIDGGETTVIVSEYEAPRPTATTMQKPPWEGRVGTEFRGASSAGVVPASAAAAASSTSALAVVGPSELTTCVPWWRDVDVTDPRAVGRWGEALVYQYLLCRYPGWRVTWLNELEESSGFYDIKLESPPAEVSGGEPARGCSETVYVEVKTTRWPDRNAFEVSPWEWDFANRPGVGRSYHVYRVYGAGDPRSVRITVIRDPARLVREHAVSMCLAV